jgi:hypothetical protein
MRSFTRTGTVSALIICSVCFTVQAQEGGGKHTPLERETVVEKVRYFENGKKASVSAYSNGMLIRETNMTQIGKPLFEREYIYNLQESTYIEIEYAFNPFPRKVINRKKKYKGSPEGDQILLYEWFYDPESHGLRCSEKYEEGTDKATISEVYDENQEIGKKYIYHYDDSEKSSKRLKGFDVLDADGAQIGLFRRDIGLDLEKIIRNRDEPPALIKERLGIYNKVGKEPVVIIDSGFDVSHPLLTHRFWKNPLEKIDGIDNDGNGWVDDIMGWQYDPLDKVDSPNINEIFFQQAGDVPISHGTWVSSIAIKDLDNVAIIGFAGDLWRPEYIKKINAFLKQHHIRFVNMSYTYLDLDVPRFTPLFEELEKMITENPQTLFCVAACNHAINLDKLPERIYPAFFTRYCDNVISVGALETHDIHERKLSEYKIAEKFSNTGNTNVDIFAPGVEVPGADAGGGQIKLNGTSASSPYVLNVALKMFKENPNLKPFEIKEIILKSAFVKDTKNPFPCVSRGIIFPGKAIKMARTRNAIHYVRRKSP